MAREKQAARKERQVAEGNWTTMELLEMGNELVPCYEHLAGESGSEALELEPGEFRLVGRNVMAENGLAVSWVGIGATMKNYPGPMAWGPPFGEVLPMLRFNLADEKRPWVVTHKNGDLMATFFPPSEPREYRICFRPLQDGFRFFSCDRYLREENEWQGCDPDTTFLLLQGLKSVLPRLMQRGE